MSSQPNEEWDDMSTARQNEIRMAIKTRLNAAVEGVDIAAYRARLARASRSHYPQADERS